jgi:hypothetical protein
MPNKLTPLTSLIMMIDIQDKLVKMVQTESIIHKKSNNCNNFKRT